MGARVALESQQLASARRYVDSAIKKVPNHAEAQFLRCSMDIAEADAASRGFVKRKNVTEDLKVAADACGQAAKSNNADLESTVRPEKLHSYRSDSMGSRPAMVTR